MRETNRNHFRAVWSKNLRKNRLMLHFGPFRGKVFWEVSWWHKRNLVHILKVASQKKFHKNPNRSKWLKEFSVLSRNVTVKNFRKTASFSSVLTIKKITFGKQFWKHSTCFQLHRACLVKKGLFILVVLPPFNWQKYPQIGF